MEIVKIPPAESPIPITPENIYLQKFMSNIQPFVSFLKGRIPNVNLFLPIFKEIRLT
jgi:hypothetical protein